MAVRVPKSEQKSQSVADRWSEISTQRGFTPVANAFLEGYGRLNITPSEAMLIIHLVSFRRTKDNPYPSVPRLAKLMRCSERYIRKMCSNLESVGLLKRIGQKGTSNQFDLSGLIKKLDAFVIEQQVESARDAQEMADTAAKLIAAATSPSAVGQPPHWVEQPRRKVHRPLPSMEMGVAE